MRLGERRRVSESELARLEKKVLTMEADQETVLTSLGEELDAVCRSLARNGEDKLQVLLHVYIPSLTTCTVLEEDCFIFQLL